MGKYTRYIEKMRNSLLAVNVRHLIDSECGGSWNEFDKRIGMPALADRILNMRASTLRPETIEKIAKTFARTVDWLESDNGYAYPLATLLKSSTKRAESEKRTDAVRSPEIISKLTQATMELAAISEELVGMTDRIDNLIQQVDEIKKVIKKVADR